MKNKNKNKNTKKLIIFIIVLVSIFIVFWLIFTHKTDYTMDYSLNSYNITEQFITGKDYYHFTIKKDNNTYELIIAKDYTPKRKLISSIEETNDKDITCLNLNDDLIDYPICKDKSGYVSKYLNTLPNPQKNDSYKNIDIYDLKNKTYLIWNYKGFYYLNKEKTTSINLFNKDTYTPYLIYPVNEEYLFIADYDADNYFTNYYLINTTKSTYKKYELDTKVYFDSYIMGSNKNSIYLVDRKENQEYEINPLKSKIYKTSGKIRVDDEWQKVDVDSLIKKEQYFKNSSKFYYQQEGNTIYYYTDTLKTKITNQKVNSIVSSSNEGVYYLSDGSLYYFSLQSGIQKLMTYSEWNFNYTNVIYPF